jgi:hypothetical protein
MRTILWPVVAVTFFSTLCNAQDDAVAAPTGGVSTAGVYAHTPPPISAAE